MSLANMVWTQVTIHDVVAAFLQSERDKFAGLPPDLMHKIDSPDTNNSLDNHFRLRLLYYVRCFLMAEIPPDTQWFEVQNLTNNELNDLYVVGRCGWDAPGLDNNQLATVALRRQETLTAPPSSWRKLILWGHDRQGPFTILEGNHRLVAYMQASQQPSFSLPIFVGLSPTPCFFHILDPPRKLANDLWKARECWPAFSY